MSFARTRYCLPPPPPLVGYTAPEVIRGEAYDASVDVFSLSIVMLEVVTMKARYSELLDKKSGAAQNWRAIENQVATKGLRPTIPDWVFPGMRVLLEDCWAENPSERPNSEIVAMRLGSIKQMLIDDALMPLTRRSKAGNSFQGEALITFCEDVFRLFQEYVSREAKESANCTFQGK